MGISFRGAKRLLTTGRYFLLVVMLFVASVVSNVSVPDSAQAAVGSVTTYTRPTPDSTLNDITVGSDGNIWYTATGPTINRRIGKMTTTGSFTEYPNQPTGIKGIGRLTAGSDGNIWYAASLPSGSTLVPHIIKMSTSGVVLGQYPIPSGQFAQHLTLGPDGNVWFTMNGSYKIGKIDTSGTVTEYLGVAGINTLTSIVAGPDGNLWFTSGATGTTIGNSIGKITTSGTYTVYPLSTYNAYPIGITVGSDGNLWFTETGARKTGKITTSGTITEHSIAMTTPGDMAAGSDGALWFRSTSIAGIGVSRMTTSGTVTEYIIPNSYPQRLITGPDGAIWYMDWQSGKIGRVATELTSQTISFTSTAPTDAAIDGPTYTPAASATSSLPVDITVDASSSSVCAIDGLGAVSFQGAGTCVLNANQAGDADYNPAPQVQQSFTVKPVNADTSVNLSCPATVSVSSTVTCTITVTNDGPAAAEATTLTAMFPGSLTGATVSGDATISGQTVTWSTPSLASEDSATFTFNATASTAGRLYINAALLQASPDPDSSNNIAGATIKAS